MTSHFDPPLTLIKVGTGVLTKASDGTLDRVALTHLVSAIAELMLAGHCCLFVSSGAVGSGVSALGLSEYPQDTATRQACAAIGQARLMEHYSRLFANFEIQIAQLLLTSHDLATADRSSNVTNTLRRLLQDPLILPIMNENDSVAVDELSFGDNDMLSVRVGKLAGVARIVLLTSVDGLLDPVTRERIPLVTDLDEAGGLVHEDRGKFSIGGMASKLKAVKFAVENGIECHIANGRVPSRLRAIFENDPAAISTRFPARV